MIPGLKKRAVNLHDILMYVFLARKHLRLMILLVVLCLAFGLNYFVYAQAIYYSKSLIKVTTVAQQVDVEKVFGDGERRELHQQLSAPHIWERTAKALGLNGNARDIKLKYVRKFGIRWNSTKNLEAETWAVSYELARRWTEEYVRQFNADRRERRIRDREVIFQKYQTDMDEYALKMSESITEKQKFDDERQVQNALIRLNMLRDLPAQIVAVSKRVDEVGLTSARVSDPSLSVIEKLSLLAAMETTKAPSINFFGDLPNLEDPKSNTPTETQQTKTDADSTQIIIPSMVSSEQPWEALDKEQRRLQAQLTELGKTYLPSHEKFRIVQSRLDEITQKLNNEFLTAKNRLEIEHARLIAKKRDLEAKLPEYQDAMIQAQNLRNEKDMLNARNLNWKNYYTEMEKKLALIDQGYDRERTEVEYMNIVDIKDNPVSPQKINLVIMALGMGLVLAVGIPFLIEYLDHTLSNLEQVETQFNLRGLGIVPKVESLGTPALLETSDSKENNLIENFRVIRTNLISMGQLSAKPPHVIMIASAMPREGKTVVSSNLAASFAQMGDRTIIVDTDLRRGRLHRLFGYRKSPGLSNVLLGEVSLEDACRPTSHPNLQLLSAGKHLDTGTELIGSEKFENLLAELRKKYDRIIVDTPPVLGLSETSVIQRYADGVLFVIWSGNTPVRNVKAAMEMLAANGANFYGFVLNRLDLSSTQNYYQYYYYTYDYYYNYSPKALEQS